MVRAPRPWRQALGGRHASPGGVCLSTPLPTTLFNASWRLWRHPTYSAASSPAGRHARFGMPYRNTLLLLFFPPGPPTGTWLGAFSAKCSHGTQTGSSVWTWRSDDPSALILISLLCRMMWDGATICGSNHSNPCHRLPPGAVWLYYFRRNIHARYARAHLLYYLPPSSLRLYLPSRLPAAVLRGADAATAPATAYLCDTYTVTTPRAAPFYLFPPGTYLHLFPAPAHARILLLRQHFFAHATPPSPYRLPTTATPTTLPTPPTPPTFHCPPIPTTTTLLQHGAARAMVR